MACNYEPGEKKASEESVMVLMDWPHEGREWPFMRGMSIPAIYAMKGYVIYDFEVNKWEIPGRKVRPANFRELVERMNRSVQPWREPPTSTTGLRFPCRGGLLRPPGPRKPKLWLMGSTDCVRSSQTNLAIHLQRARSFRVFLRTLDEWARDAGIRSDLRNRASIYFIRRGSYHLMRQFFHNRDRLHRAQNRSVLIWYGRGGGNIWTLQQQRNDARTNLRNLMRTAHQRISSGGAVLNEERRFGRSRDKALWRKTVGNLCRIFAECNSVYDLYFRSGGVGYYCCGTHDWGHRQTWNVSPDETRAIRITNIETGRSAVYHNIGLGMLEKELIEAIICARNLTDLIGQVDYWSYVMFEGLTNHARLARGLETPYGGRRYNSSVTRLGDWLDDQSALRCSVYSAFKPFKEASTRPWF